MIYRNREQWYGHVLEKGDDRVKSVTMEVE